MPLALPDLVQIHLALSALVENPIISAPARNKLEVLKGVIQKELEQRSDLAPMKPPRRFIHRPDVMGLDGGVVSVCILCAGTVAKAKSDGELVQPEHDHVCDGPLKKPGNSLLPG